ncbi:hypothetical protein ACNAN0_02830 [Agrilactobacillus fermenti]|uniref:hypothetical protein n=1 Tax=Agrilactobacillus fermenti TaxID=2586909 RepID=UPI001E31D1E5|nr:hypothetical protein [Agrilactobacillus fermenti]MCD2256347.1 hypothetical protein [Agrilactobacillus fermenti]
MSLFNNNRQIHKILEERGLSHCSKNVAYQAEAILSELDRKNLLRESKRLNLEDRADEEIIAYLRALVEQNWILVQQNNEILNHLKQTTANESAS